MRSIGIDEVLGQKGYKFLTVVYQIDSGVRRLLWVGQDRKAKTLLRFFRRLGPERSARLHFICTDMWQPYVKVIARKASGAIQVLDRFHIMTYVSKAIDEVRAKEAKSLKAAGYEPVLTPTCSRRTSSSSGSVSLLRGPVSSSTAGAAARCAPGSSP
ncbi:MAG TPA: transposase [Gemmatimonadaceae bacterium]